MGSASPNIQAASEATFTGCDAPTLFVFAPFAACPCAQRKHASYLFSFLWNPGPGRALGETVLRRLFSLLLDAGVARSDKRTRALPVLAGSAVAALAALAALRKRRA